MSNKAKLVCHACGREIGGYGKYYDIGGVAYCPECVRKGKHYANKNGQADKINHDNGSDGNYI